MNVNWIPVTLLTFWQIRTNAFLCSYYIVVYVYRISAERKVKINAITAENMVTFGKNKSLLKLNWQCEIQLYDNCFNQLYERQLQKMVEHTQTICQQQPTIFFLSAFDHFVELVLKGLMIFWQFRTNAFFSSSYLIAYIWTVPPNRWSKWTYQCLRKWPYLKEKKPFWSLSHKLKINCIPIALLIFWQFRENIFFSFSKKIIIYCRK